MNNVLVVGTQWGDEGKGKIVDWLSERADIVVRFQGGHNAGHTIKIAENTYKLSLLPSGIVRNDTLSIIGNGAIVNPWALMEEIKRVEKQGIRVSPDNLYIAENVSLILPIHETLDKIRESLRGSKKIGTTKRGIGPAYEDKVARRAIRLCDLADDTTIEHRVDALLQHYTPLFDGMGQQCIDRGALLQSLKQVAPQILPYARVVWQYLDKARKAGKRILFEGAQGALLDVDHGTYPFVTSCNTVAGQAMVGAGVGSNALGQILGITKAYTTRVGSGPFPTELFDAVGDRLGERGHESGTVTNRKRRCGWFDAVLTCQAATIGGITAICLTKLDVLDGLEEIKICTAYDVDGKRYTHYPANANIQNKVKPVYETVKGWKENTYGCRNIRQLPKNALMYIKRLEHLIGVPVTIISTSPERNDTILLQDPFGA